jgi:hypothetical protein
MSNCARWAAVGAGVFATLCLSACKLHSPDSPAGATVSAAYGVKEVVLSWEPVNGAEFYRVMKNPDGVSGFSQVGNDLTTTSYVDTVAVHLTDWANESYLVEACNGGGCTDSNPVTALDPVQTTGYFKASNTGSGDRFGQALALSADGLTLAVGSTDESSSAAGIGGDQFDSGAADSGAVYVFAFVGGAWRQQAYIKASNSRAGEKFGAALGLSADGDTLVVGAPSEASDATGINGDQADTSATQSGAVYVFTRDGITWTQRAYIKASNAQAGDAFGVALSLSSDGLTLAVGAPLESGGTTGVNGNQADNSASSSGAVYVFGRSGEQWQQLAYVKASNTDALDQFGHALSLGGDGMTLAVGAPYESSAAGGIGGNPGDNSALQSGAVYIFTRAVSGAWSQQVYIKASNAQAGDWFGYALGLSDDGVTLAVGAPQEASNATGINGNQADNSAPSSGAVYVFARSGGVWHQKAYVKASNTDMNDSFGGSLSLSGDGAALAVAAVNEAGGSAGIDGDQSDNSADQSGAVYVFISTAGAWHQQSYVKASNAQERDLFGSSLSLSADGGVLAVGGADESGGATGIDGNQHYDSAAASGAVYLY